MSSIDVEALVNALKIGNVSGGNYQQVDTDGTVRLYGAATAWRDVIADLFGRRLNSTTGKVDYDWDKNAIKFQSGGSISNASDRVQGNQEFNHDLKIGNITLYPHMHYYQEVTSHSPDVLDTTAFQFTWRYILVKNGYGYELDGTEWNSATYTFDSSDWVYDNTNANGKSYMAQIIKFPSISLTGVGVSDTLVWQMARTDSLGGTVYVYFLDWHAEVDAFGSATEWVK